MFDQTPETPPLPLTTLSPPTDAAMMEFNGCLVTGSFTPPWVGIVKRNKAVTHGDNLRKVIFRIIQTSTQCYREKDIKDSTEWKNVGKFWKYTTRYQW